MNILSTIETSMDDPSGIGPGPIPPDTMFAKATMTRATSHLKWQDSDGEEMKRMEVNGVNITVGLPIIRVSVDHGTAFDVSGMGIASEAAMSLSIDYATRMVMEARSPHYNP